MIAEKVRVTDGEVPGHLLVVDEDDEDRDDRGLAESPDRDKRNVGRKNKRNQQKNRYPQTEEGRLQPLALKHINAAEQGKKDAVGQHA